MSYAEDGRQNFNGLSTVTKPTLAGTGSKIKNGSRWREVDTGKTKYYNSSDDTWYTGDQYLKSILGAAPTVDIRSLELLESILITLKKIEFHLSIATDTNLRCDDV